MIRIYHNTKCGTSRKALEILDHSGQAYEIVEYLKTPLSKEKIADLLHKMKKTPMDIVRSKEPLWATLSEDKTLSDDEILNLLATHPILIERPIVENGDKAALGRPAEQILSVL